jgi:hypothetical protein
VSAEVFAQAHVVEELLRLELVHVDVEAGALVRGHVDGIQVLDGDRDVHDRPRGEPGHRGRPDVLDPTQLRSERGADLVGLGGEARRPGVVVLDDLDGHSGVTYEAVSPPSTRNVAPLT